MTQEPRRAQINGVEIAYDEWPGESPPIFMQDAEPHPGFVAHFAEIAAFAGKPTTAETPVPGDIHPDDREEYLASLVKMDPATPAAAAEGDMTRGWDPESLLPKIEATVQLQQGSPSLGSALPPAHGDRAAALLRSCEGVHFEDAGHLIPMDTPGALPRGDLRLHQANRGRRVTSSREEARKGEDASPPLPRCSGPRRSRRL